jgi:hypothetical protein
MWLIQQHGEFAEHGAGLPELSAFGLELAGQVP